MYTINNANYDYCWKGFTTVSLYQLIKIHKKSSTLLSKRKKIYSIHASLCKQDILNALLSQYTIHMFNSELSNITGYCCHSYEYCCSCFSDAWWFFHDVTRPCYFSWHASNWCLDTTVNYNTVIACFIFRFCRDLRG